MKNKIFKLIEKLFPLQLQNYYNQQLNQEKDFMIKDFIQEKAFKEIHKNFPLNTKVIVRTNEPDPLLIGFIVGYKQYHRKTYLLVQDEISKKVSMPMETNLMIFTEERLLALQKLDWAEQYNVMTKNKYFISLETQKEKESKLLLP